MQKKLHFASTAEEAAPAVGSTYNRELFKNGATEKRANQREYDIETSDSMATW